MLTDTQIERYSRQIILPQVGGRGQEKLLAAAVGIVGNDPLTAAAGLYLAAAGVGTLGVSAAAVASLAGQNPDCRVAALSLPETPEATTEVAHNFSVFIDATGPIDTSFILAAAVWRAGRPLVWGVACGSVGWVTVLDPALPRSPCYVCSGAQRPVLSTPTDGPGPLAEATAQFVGTLAAMEVIKLVLGIGTSLAGRLLCYDASSAAVTEAGIAGDPHCAVCGPEARAGQRTMTRATANLNPGNLKLESIR